MSEVSLMSKITKWQHGIKSANSALAHQDYATLDNFVYDKNGDGRLEGSKAIATTLNSYYIGDQHAMSSGGENVFTQNQTTGVNWYPAWSGLKDHRDPANRGPEGLIGLTYREYSEYVYQDTFSGVVNTNSVECLADTVPTYPLSVLGVRLKTAEKLGKDHVLYFSVAIDNGSGRMEEARVVYEQEFKNVDYNVGDVIEWWFDHPIDAYPKYNFFISCYAKFKNEDRKYLKSFGSGIYNTIVNTKEKPWTELFFRTFEDVALSSDPVSVYIIDVVKVPPPGSVTIIPHSSDGYSIDYIETDAITVKVIAQWERGRNNLDTATVNGVNVTIVNTTGSTHTGEAIISLAPSVSEITLKVGRYGTKTCGVIPI